MKALTSKVEEVALRSDQRNKMNTYDSMVSLKILKQFAVDKLSKDSPLYHILVAEDDEIPVHELPNKVKLWLKLLQYSVRRA